MRWPITITGQKKYFYSIPIEMPELHCNFALTSFVEKVSNIQQPK